jgi:hypothetical protein
MQAHMHGAADPAAMSLGGGAGGPPADAYADGYYRGHHGHSHGHGGGQGSPIPANAGSNGMPPQQPHPHSQLSQRSAHSYGGDSERDELHAFAGAQTGLEESLRDLRLRNGAPASSSSRGLSAEEEYGLSSGRSGHGASPDAAGPYAGGGGGGGYYGGEEAGRGPTHGHGHHMTSRTAPPAMTRGRMAPGGAPGGGMGGGFEGGYGAPMAGGRMQPASARTLAGPLDHLNYAMDSPVASTQPPSLTPRSDHSAGMARGGGAMSGGGSGHETGRSAHGSGDGSGAFDSGFGGGGGPDGGFGGGGEGKGAMPASFAIDLDRVLSGLDGRPTVMIRNIPNKYNQTMLVEELNAAGFRGLYDFFYLPIDLRTNVNVGYAFCNLRDPRTVASVVQALGGIRWPRFNSKKRADVTFARIQGLDALISRFSASPIIHRFPPECHPLLFNEEGFVMPFPFQPMRASAGGGMGVEGPIGARGGRPGAQGGMGGIDGGSGNQYGGSGQGQQSQQQMQQPPEQQMQPQQRRQQQGAPQQRYGRMPGGAPGGGMGGGMGNARPQPFHGGGGGGAGNQFRGGAGYQGTNGYSGEGYPSNNNGDMHQQQWSQSGGDGGDNGWSGASDGRMDRGSGRMGSASHQGNGRMRRGPYHQGQNPGGDHYQMAPQGQQGLMGGAPGSMGGGMGGPSSSPGFGVGQGLNPLSPQSHGSGDESRFFPGSSGLSDSGVFSAGYMPLINLPVMYPPTASTTSAAPSLIGVPSYPHTGFPAGANGVAGNNGFGMSSGLAVPQSAVQPRTSGALTPVSSSQTPPALYYYAQAGSGTGPGSLTSQVPTAAAGAISGTLAPTLYWPSA